MSVSSLYARMSVTRKKLEKFQTSSVSESFCNEKIIIYAGTTMLVKDFDA